MFKRDSISDTPFCCRSSLRPSSRVFHPEREALYSSFAFCNAACCSGVHDIAFPYSSTAAFRLASISAAFCDVSPTAEATPFIEEVADGTLAEVGVVSVFAVDNADEFKVFAVPVALSKALFVASTTFVPDARALRYADHARSF